MDIKQLPCHMRVKASGIQTPLLSADKPIHKLIHEALIWIAGQAVRKDGSGEREVTITIRTGPFMDDDTAKRNALLFGYGDDIAAYLRDYGDVPKESELSEEDQKLFNRPVPPWTKDENWIRFQYFMASRNNYVTALPGEVRQLQDALKAKWGKISWHDQDGNRVDFTDEMIRDRKA